VEMGLGPYYGPGPRSKYARNMVKAMGWMARILPAIGQAGAMTALARGGGKRKRSAEVLKRNRAKKKLALAYRNVKNVNTNSIRRGFVKKGFSTKGYVKKARSKKRVYSSHICEEVSGVISDKDCVYITHVACDTYQLIEEIVKVCIRKLFERAGMVLRDNREIISGENLADGSGFRIELISENLDSSDSVRSVMVGYDTADGTTIAIAANAFFSAFLSISSTLQTLPGAGSDANGNVLSKFILWETTAVPTKRLAAELDLKNIEIDLFSKSELKFQNRSRSGDGTEQIDNVNNNPLVGYMYNFRGIPKTRMHGPGALQSIPSNRGVQLVRASQLNANNSANFKEPPRSGDFINCTGKKKIYLNPGQVKSTTIYTQKSMGLYKLLKALKYHAGEVADAYQSFYSIFPTQMIALEDVINVDLTEKIEVAYEVDRKLSVGCRVKRTHMNIRNFFQETFDNVQPPDP